MRETCASRALKRRLGVRRVMKDAPGPNAIQGPHAAEPAL
jgi:hypothetical protein